LGKIREEGEKDKMNIEALRTCFLWNLLVLSFIGISDAQGLIKVKRVVDGDTLLLADGERVRLGPNTIAKYLEEFRKYEGR
jgi:hypothetical protein